MTEQFYRDIAALQEGAIACLEYTEDVSDLGAWVLAQTAARAGENILAIGCDSNEQTISLARTLGPRGYVLAIDRSYRALTALCRSSQAGGLEQTIRFLYLNLDDLGGHLRPEDFDRVLCGRALLHVKQPRAVFQAIRRALKVGGIFFFYGPTRKDLMELRLFHAALRHETCESREQFFVEQLGLRHAHDTFAQVDLISFESPLCFTSPDALYIYWRESELYEEELDRDFRYAAVQHFRSYSTFETAQRLVGVKAING
ncbi:MAG TPA: methyltransferase domain-containing protein [Ktedonobacteraceae bacterium]